MYYIEIAANTCICKIVLNGLGVGELNAEKVGSFQYPCNTELVGKENHVALEIQPATLDLAMLDKIQAEVLVKKYAPGEMLGPESGEIIANASLQREIALIKANPLALNIADHLPFKISAKFDSSDAPSFATRLLEAKPIDKEDALKDWAMAFRSLLEHADIDGLFALYEPKLIDYDSAYPDQKEPDNREWFRNWMRNKIFPQTPFIGFKRDDIVPVKWCDGRIWELRLKDGGSLWHTEGLEGRKTKIEIYVGLDNGTIKIIR